MNLKLEKSTAKKLYPDAPKWFQEVMLETFGVEFFKKKEFTEIKTFEDACQELGICESDVFSESDTPDEIAYKKLKVIVRAINQGWEPDWSNTDQRKYYPWFEVLSSGVGFSDSGFNFGYSPATVGSRLCFETKEKSDYAGKQFKEEYEQFLTLNK